VATIRESADRFLSLKRIAVAGVSRDARQPANGIYRKLRDTRHEVFPVNPNATEVEGDRSFPDIASIPGGVDGVVIATNPRVSEAIVQQCISAGIRNVWMHRSFGSGSVSTEAVRLCRENGISVIDGACPLMYCEPVDAAHKCFRWLLGAFGRLPRSA
jgi:predicted CoA-binding protein